MALNPKQQRFVDEYLVDLNGKQAAIRAGYSPKTAIMQASRLLTNDDVAAYLTEARKALSDRTAITQDMVLNELAKIGFADIRKAIVWRSNVTGMVQEEDGTERLAVTNEVQLINSEDLDEGTAAAIAEISQGAQGVLKIKLYDKRSALVDIGRHLGMFKERLEITGTIGFADMAEEAMRLRAEKHKR